HRRASWRRTFEWAAVGAVAAMVFLFAWTFTSRSKGPLPQSPAKDLSSKSQAPMEAKLALAPQSVAVVPADETYGASVEVADTSASSTFVASDFVPVPYTGGISADDPGMVVRVELNRASLAQLGYPIAETPDEDLIRADVLVGQ